VASATGLANRQESAPDGAEETLGVPAPPPGRVPFWGGNRWLAPPPNFARSLRDAWAAKSDLRSRFKRS
jgi:hypothetical protein